jgi:hypothetical protein
MPTLTGARRTGGIRSVETYRVSTVRTTPRIHALSSLHATDQKINAMPLTVRHTRRFLGLGVLALWVTWTTVAMAASPSAEIVVANRYLQAKGVSHAHLYLYSEDGRFLRQLTHMKLGQDRNPMFAPDGETILFTHETEKGTDECWRVGRNGSGLQRLESAPEWYLR